jgi:predicted dehydrogenase
VAVVGVGHYHAFSPPNYLRILQTEKTEIVGVHDPDAAIAAKYATAVGSTPFTDERALIEKTKPEFVVALGHHAAMPATFRYLVETGVPFLMEKPWGTDDRTVRELADLAESKKAWVAVPMPFRYSWWAETARRMRERGELGAISHILFRFNQPGVQRYIDSGSSWILTKAEAGGGALLNLGIHGFDVIRYITGEEPNVVAGVTSHATQRREVEDYAHVTMRTPSGVVCLVEASYTYPTNGSDQERKVASEKAVLTAVTAGGEGVHVASANRPGGGETVRAPESYLASWPGAVNDCLNRIGRGEPPAVTARDCARAVTLTFDAYRMAGEVR